MNFKMIKRILAEDQKGMSLLTVLIFVFVLVTIVVSLLVMASNDIKLSSIHEDSTKAFYIAEAGLAEAIEIIDNNWENNQEGITGFPLENIEYGEGSYSVSAEEKTIEGEEGETKDGIELTSEGVVFQNGERRASRKVQIKVGQLAEESTNHIIFDYAIAGRNLIKLEDIGSGVEGDLYCEGDIENEGVPVDGIANATGTIEGDENFTGTNEGIEAILDWPTAESFLAEYSESNTEEFGSPGVTYTRSTYWQLDPNTIYHCLGNLKVSEGVTIDGPGIIVVDGWVKFEENSSCGTSEETAVVIVSDSTNSTDTDPAIKFEDSSYIYGILFAPDGYVKVETKSAVHGSVIAGIDSSISVKIETDSWVHYFSTPDSIELPTSNTEYIPAVVAWQEVN
ncbi:MAG: pilus assembly PilX N-terminal domain-containing protein [Kosmotogaceae bacterium]